MKRRLTSSLLLLALPMMTTTAGCSALGSDGNGDRDDNEHASENAMTSSGLDAKDVKAVIAKLTQVRSSRPIGAYYQDGASGVNGGNTVSSRLEGCWRNPAGAKLTDLKKTFYCSMPLEFRLCNTVVLLTVDESKVDERYAAYLDCQTKVDGVFGDKGLFVFGAEIDAMYKRLYLKGETLSSESDTFEIVNANKPELSDRSFPVVVLAIGKTLTKEAVELSVDGLSALVHDYQGSARNDPR